MPAKDSLKIMYREGDFTVMEAAGRTADKLILEKSGSIESVKEKGGKKIIKIRTNALEDFEAAWNRYYEGGAPKLSPYDEC
ncbi:MAG: hypothetical protein J4431_01975 [Candidatus Aenigmarchaeota archaeon]|nr:hypothetical protein [Candidatus Aenigmarchaeota archaeon]